MKTGTVKFFNEEKGFGFVRDDESKDEYFFHISDCEEAMMPAQNDKVSFELGENKRGPCAEDVKSWQL